MVSVVEWYLAELDSRLRNRMPEPACSGLLAEIRMHLESAAEDLEAQGHSREEAERIATNRFGRPSRIAWRLLEAHSPRHSQPLSRWPVVWAGAATLWAGACLALGIYPLEMLALKIGLPLLLIAFAISGSQSRRARPWAIAGAAFGAFLATWATLSFTWLNLYMVGGLGQLPVWRVSQYRTDIQHEISYWNQVLPQLESGVEAFSKPQSSSAQNSFRTSGGWLAPVEPQFGWWTGPQPSGQAPRPTQIQYRTVADWEDAKDLWLTVGRRGVSAIGQTLSTEQTSLVALEQARDVPITRRAKDSFIELAPPSVAWLLALLLANFVCVWLGELARWMRVRQVRIA